MFPKPACGSPNQQHKCFLGADAQGMEVSIEAWLKTAGAKYTLANPTWLEEPRAALMIGGGPLAPLGHGA